MFKRVNSCKSHCERYSSREGRIVGEDEIRKKLKLVEELRSEYSDIAQYLDRDPNRVVQEHIRLLKEYNDLRDVGKMLIKKVASMRGVNEATILTEMGMSQLEPEFSG